MMKIKYNGNQKRKKTLFCLVVFLFFFTQFLNYNPFTPLGAIRWSVLWNGFVIKSYMVKAEVVPPSELGKIPDGISDDLSIYQTVYQVTSPVLENRTFSKEMQYWIVSKRKNGAYYAAFSG